MDSITRRDLLKKTAIMAAGSALLLNRTVEAWANEQEATTKVVLIRNQQLFAQGDTPDPAICRQMLDQALANLTGKNDIKQVWAEIIKPTDVVGIKSNAWNLFPTPAIMEQIIKERVIEAGVKAENVSVNDRNVIDDPIFQKSTAIINIRPMRTHAWSGVGSLIKNYITFAKDRPSYHDDSCAALATLHELPQVKGKARLHILVMFNPLFHHLAANRISEEHMWKYNGILVGFDPVAVDSVGLRIIEGKRNEFFKENRPLNPPAKHIVLADTRYHLGTVDPAKINLVKLGWDVDSFV